MLAQRRQPLDVRGTLLGATGLWGRFLHVINQMTRWIVNDDIKEYEEFIHHCLYHNIYCFIYTFILKMILSTDRFQARLLSLRSYNLQESSSSPCVFFSCVCHCARFPVYTLSQSHTHAAHALQYPSMFSLNISVIGFHLTILTRYRNYSWSRNSDPSETLWVVSTCFDMFRPGLH